MYQFWLNAADSDVVRFLKYFTFLPLDRVAELGEVTRTSPERREAQRILARTVTELIHGPTALREAEASSTALFRARPEEPLPEGSAVPGAVLPYEAATWPLWKVLSKTVERAGAPMSTSEARRLVQQGGVEVDGRRATSVEQQTPAGPHTVKIGKRRIYRVIIDPT
jgi:tyrosyl-tRNA synthetase